MRTSRILFLSILGLVLTLGAFWGIALASSEPADLNSPSASSMWTPIQYLASATAHHGTMPSKICRQP
jgi:hypothetical protein